MSVGHGKAPLIQSDSLENEYGSRCASGRCRFIDLGGLAHFKQGDDVGMLVPLMFLHSYFLRVVEISWL